MVNGTGFNGFPGPTNRTRFPDQSVSPLPNQSFTSVAGHLYDGFSYTVADAAEALPPPDSELTLEEDSPEDCDFSDVVLNYINQMLMEEDMEDKACMLQESLDLEAAERSLYEAIGKKYPPSPEPNLAYAESNGETQDHELSGNFAGNLVDGECISRNGWTQSLRSFTLDFRNSQSRSSALSASQSSYSSPNSIATYGYGLDEPSNTLYPSSDANGERQSVWLFRRGIEEARKFLPGENELIVDFRGNSNGEMAVKEEAKDENGRDRGRKNPNRDEIGLEEERSSKLPAVFPETIVRSDVADKILVHVPGQDSMKEFNALRDSLKKGVEKKKNTCPREERRGRRSNRRRGSGRGQNGKPEVVDLRSLLIHCAQAVAADDRRNANELLKQIRQHSTPFGDGNQRLGHCFANGLEARLAGTGSQIYKGLMTKSRSASDVLKAYHLFLACCPFRKLSNFISNKTIKDSMGNSQRLHVIDFGILYGFQWPTLIQRLSLYGSPKVRITGIEFPQPGFRPAQRVEETGQRLAAYAEEFGVPFEYTAIAKKWDTIQLEELKIEKDEFLVINCLYRAENLHDETVKVESSRDAVLNLIRKINPDLFIHGIVNGAYNAPFFVTRFREALFHFSSIFDMLETIVPREDESRRLLEMEVFGREALNIIACEGWERVERPETYKQWQVRTMRSGFVQVPFDPAIMKMALRKVQLHYHKDFVIDEDSRWVLQGWKGRTVMALSAWKPISKAL
ncbi:PREDICTED: scarecrow-like protein 9 [Tarenaya hassleriana]|uniref:scarecrow-like protein 9 n=1 Tax=Tarenaya hassleriana TaxID=28532 RepID=UPI00053C779A|nr:PREDICTED: scarecrow-like protein 9 [Tarenaya hassleriana]